MALYIPQSILHLARSLYVRPETYGPTYVCGGTGEEDTVRVTSKGHQTGCG